MAKKKQSSKLKKNFKDKSSKFPSKKITKFSIIGVLVILFLAVLIYIVSINVKLLFDTETHIVLSPSIVSLETTTGVPASIDLNVDVQKLAICGVTCSHQLIDSSSGTIIRNFSEPAPNHKSYSYELPVPKSGSGQLIYNYKLTCSNDKSRICPSSSNKTYSSSAFITVNYDLSLNAKSQQDSLEMSVYSLLDEIVKIKNLLLENSAKLNSLNYADTNLPKENSLSAKVSSLNSFIDLIEQDLPELFSLWAYEDILGVQEKFLLINSKLNSVNLEVENLSSDVDSLYSGFNSDIAILNNISNNLTYDSLAKFYLRNNISKFNELVSLNNTFNSLTLDVNNKSFTSYSQLSFDVSALNIKLLILNSDYQDKLKLIKQSSLDLFTNYNSTYSLVTSQELNYTSDFCTSFPVIVKTLENYNSDVNVSSLNESQKDFYDSYSLDLLDNNSHNNLSNNIYFKFPLAKINSFINLNCDLKNVNIFNNFFERPDLSFNFEKLSNNLSLPQTTGQCCFNGNCSNCCTDETCNDLYPIILVHGHSFSKSTSPELAFTRLSFIQDALTADGYINGGVIDQNSDLENISFGTWGKTPAPIVLGVSYYYLNYYDVGGLNFITRKTDSIENYALRLRESIDLILEKTGKDKVILIAHSMGGLVTREYVALFGEDKVDKLIILGSPNYGIEGDIKRYCTVTGAKAECNDMYANSIFLTRLNSEKNYFIKTKAYTIRAAGCDMKSDIGREDGDGVVLARNVPLPFATNYIISGNCTDFFGTNLHMNFVNPNLYPKTYELITNILNSN